jgi:choline/carnitine/betaine transport
MGEKPDSTKHAEDVVGDAVSATASGSTSNIDKVVFGVAAGITVVFVLWGALGRESLGNVSGRALDWLETNGGWAFVLAASGFVVFALWLAFSRYGRIRLGKDEEEPEFRTVSWVAMMFSAGMGIGLMFFGVVEPLAHYTEPPPGTAQPDTNAALDVSMATTLFHWTLHPWAMYAVVGLAIAYGTFRRGRSQLISSVFTPLIGRRRAEGAAGKAIDVMAIFATLFGSAASLGLGALQIGRGISAVGWLDQAGTGLLVAVIAVLTFAFVLSAISGVAKGIQWLSNTNMVLAVVLAAFVFVVGPTVFILNLIPTAIGDYVADFAAMAARTSASGGAAMSEWLSLWTVFYWAWWISWTPFVGMFIARISRGRTIREFVVGVMLVPSAVSLLWFAIFGGSAIDQQRSGVDLAGAATQEEQLFGLLDQFPLALVTSIIVMVLVAIFFVSGADAASVVMGTMSQRGTIHPARPVVAFWGVLTGAVALIMLLVGAGGASALEGLQNLTILVAAPFGIVMLGMCVSLAKDLRQDPLMQREDKSTEVVEEAVKHGDRRYDGDFRLEVRPMNVPGQRSEQDERARSDR